MNTSMEKKITVAEFCKMVGKTEEEIKGGNLDLIGTGITSLPDNLTVGGDLNLSGTGITIGDASGKEGQWSDSDKKTAENFVCDYMDVDDFVKLVNSVEDEI